MRPHTEIIETRGLLCRRVKFQVSIKVLFNDSLQWLHVVFFQRVLYIDNVVWRGSVFFDKVEHFGRRNLGYNFIIVLSEYVFVRVLNVHPVMAIACLASVNEYGKDGVPDLGVVSELSRYL